MLTFCVEHPIQQDPTYRRSSFLGWLCLLVSGWSPLLILPPWLLSTCKFWIFIQFWFNCILNGAAANETSSECELKIAMHFQRAPLKPDFDFKLFLTPLISTYQNHRGDERNLINPSRSMRWRLLCFIRDRTEQMFFVLKISQEKRSRTKPRFANFPGRIGTGQA